MDKEPDRFVETRTAGTVQIEMEIQLVRDMNRGIVTLKHRSGDLR